MTSLFIFVVLLALGAAVFARPFAKSDTLIKSNTVSLEGLINTRDLDSRSHWLVKKDSPNLEPDILINTPHLIDDNEPIKRNSGDFESEAMINTPLLVDDNEPVKRNNGDFESEAMINTPLIVDDDEPIKRDSGGFQSEAMINTPFLQETDDNQPIKRENIDEVLAFEGGDKEKRKPLPNFHPLAYFTNEKADGSDDLFEGISADPPQYWDTDYGN